MKTYRLLEADGGCAILQCEHDGHRLILDEGDVVEIEDGSGACVTPPDHQRNGSNS